MMQQHNSVVLIYCFWNCNKSAGFQRSTTRARRKNEEQPCSGNAENMWCIFRGYRKCREMHRLVRSLLKPHFIN